MKKIFIVRSNSSFDPIEPASAKNPPTTGPHPGHWIDTLRVHSHSSPSLRTEHSGVGVKRTGRQGFTLTEIMVAIAIVGILAAVVLVSMSIYAKKARASRVMSQLSSVIPSLGTWFMNGGTIISPGSSGGGDICDEESTYGQWPSISGAPGNYAYDTSSFDFSGPKNWYFKAQSSSSYDNIAICCNSTMNSCGNIGIATTACAQSTTW